MATVLLLQLAIAALACGVLVIAAAPALTRPNRTPSRPDLDTPEVTTAMVREAAGFLAARLREQGSAALTAPSRATGATGRLGAQVAARLARAAAAAGAAMRAAGVRAGGAIRRLGATAIAAATRGVGTARGRVRSVRDARRRARAERAELAFSGQLRQQLQPAHPVIDLRDRPPARDPAGPRHRA